MSQEICQSCRSPKANFKCGVCEGTLCKRCSQFLSEDTFSFLDQIPEVLKHTYYCHPCYDDQVAPALETYNETMERARGLYCFFTTQKKSVPMLRKSKEKVQVKACPDRDETILRLAFFAAQQGFNAITEVALTCEKVRNLAYQNSLWHGIAIPTEVDVEKLERMVGGRKVFE